MNTVILIIFVHSVVLFWAFGMGWFVNLFTGYEKEKSKEKNTVSLVSISGDLLLLLFDCFPLFWIFRAIPEVPSVYKSARERWDSEKSVRRCFYLWLISGIFTIASGYLLFIIK